MKDTRIRCARCGELKDASEFKMRSICDDCKRKEEER